MRVNPGMAVLLVSTMLIAGCVTETTTRIEPAGVEAEIVQRQLDLGIGYLRNGDYTRAKEKLNRALEIDPRNAPVHTTFGMLFQLEGEYELAEKHFRSAVRFDSESAQVRNSYGAFLFAQQRYQEAIEQLNIASEDRFYPNRAVVFENLGMAYKRTGDMVAAEQAFTRASKLNPEQPRALLELAEIKFDEQNYVRSRELFARYNRVAPATSRSLWLCVRISRVFKDVNQEASCGEALEGIFPASEEYKKYKESV